MSQSLCDATRFRLTLAHALVSFRQQPYLCRQIATDSLESNSNVATKTANQNQVHHKQQQQQQQQPANLKPYVPTRNCDNYCSNNWFLRQSDFGFYPPAQEATICKFSQPYPTQQTTESLLTTYHALGLLHCNRPKKSTSYRCKFIHTHTHIDSIKLLFPSH